MKTLAKTLSICAALLLPAAAFAQVIVPGIRNSSHDLSATSGTMDVKGTNTQICIYCHTPHKAQSTQFLWNHTPTTNTVWAWGNDLDGNALTKTSTGTPLPTTLRSGSKRCLGCHDGSVALGDVTNAADGAAGIIAGLGAIAGKTDTTGKLIDVTHQVGVGGAMGGNHPVSIPYAGQTGYNGQASSVKNMGGVIGGYYDATTANCVSTTGVCTTAPTGDGRNGSLINLVPQVAGGTTSLGVECVSCHEPHGKYGNAFFTRIDVGAASGLCRSCHNK